MVKNKDNGLVTYSVKELLHKLNTQVESMDRKLDSKADVDFVWKLFGIGGCIIATIVTVLVKLL